MDEKMIDDMGGLYTHASEAYRAGKQTGRDDFYRAIMAELSKLSVKQERTTNAAAFHVAEMACRIVRLAKDSFDKQKVTL